MLLTNWKMDIRICIAELLSIHDCVIIPGLGGFIGNYSPARIDPVHHTFRPPFKKLLFNINLKQNDGLLANALADSLGTSYNESCALIDQFAEECRYALKTGTFVVLPDVGRLFSGKEGNIQFEQDKNANLLSDSFGLVQFISPPVSRSGSLLGRDTMKISTGIRRPDLTLFWPRAMKWAAILVLPIGLAAVIGLTRYNKISFNTTNDANILSSVLSRFTSTSLVEKKYVPVKHVTPRPAIGNVVVPVVQPEIKAAPVTKDVPLTETKTAVISKDDPFAVIVGVFRMKEYAEKRIAELSIQGVEATIFDRSRTGLYRVTIGTSSEREKADQMLALAKSSDFRDAWLLAK